MTEATNAHAYQAVTALFTATGPRAGAAIKVLGLHPNTPFSIRRKSDGTFLYADESTKEYALISLEVAKDGTPTIATINGKELPKESA